MNPSFLAIEVLVFALFGLCLWHAVRIGRGKDTRYPTSWGPLAALVGTFVFTYLLEYQLGNPDNPQSIYRYPDSFLAQGKLTLWVPLWIPIGWSFVVYIAMRTSSKLEPDWKVRPLLDGLLALNLDFSLDPVAALNGWWRWKTEQLYVFSRAQIEAAERAQPGLDCLRDIGVEVLVPARGVLGGSDRIPLAAPEARQLDWIPADLIEPVCRPFVEPGYAEYFGIPLRNFHAWFLIVASFSFAFRAIRHLWLHPRGRFGLRWQLLAAALAIVPSALVIMVYKRASEAIGNLQYAPTQGVVVFTLLWGVTVLFIASRWFIYRHDHRLDRFLWLTPLVLQAFFFCEVFARKGYLMMPELAIFIPTTAAVGVFVFGWPYLDDIRRILGDRGLLYLLRPGAGLAEHLPQDELYDPDGVDDR